jgi:hypothetical protein
MRAHESFKNAPTKAQRTRSNSNEKTAKSTNLIDILPLITVWLLVELCREDYSLMDALALLSAPTT